ncbi:hypothetical protein C8N36_101380 [Pelagimonas varians]|uniref:Uncharacterized protein n=1 Tax=Pelagimonas varians TaxID=696760 RepID=A0A238JQ68_9RHOB|nr:hypothetical protein C8N36_101380 [Pelagimonas varians]SMX32685.1 hypothetical protein PEV8663_00087 [Pelagimonas varians]
MAGKLGIAILKPNSRSAGKRIRTYAAPKLNAGKVKTANHPMFKSTGTPIETVSKAQPAKKPMVTKPVRLAICVCPKAGIILHRMAPPITGPKPVVCPKAIAAAPVLRASCGSMPVRKCRCAITSYCATAQKLPAVASAAANQRHRGMASKAARTACQSRFCALLHKSHIKMRPTAKGKMRRKVSEKGISTALTTGNSTHKNQWFSAPNAACMLKKHLEYLEFD